MTGPYGNPHDGVFPPPYPVGPQRQVPMTSPPMPSPEACLEVAHRHQMAAERLPSDSDFTKTDGLGRSEHLVLAQNNALLAVAGFLAQQHICDHGVRGWCPSCHLLLKEGNYRG